MINNKVPRILISIILSLFIFQTAHAQSDWSPAKNGNKIILIRHSLAPGTGDPEGFKLNECSTQRNLSQIGIDQSKRIGELFKKNKIQIGQVLTSQWCRCKDTAKYAFKKYTRNFLSVKFNFSVHHLIKMQSKQLKELKSFVKKWDGEWKKFNINYTLQ